MEFVKIYESRYTDGYTPHGDGVYFLNPNLALNYSKEKHSGYYILPAEHIGLATGNGDGEYFIIQKTITINKSYANKQKKREEALNKLTQEEKELLGLVILKNGD